MFGGLVDQVERASSEVAKGPFFEVFHAPSILLYRIVPQFNEMVATFCELGNNNSVCRKIHDVVLI